MVKISVIIPTYKPKAYLKDCLDSLCSQQLDHQLYEIILVLNGCDAPYKAWIEQYIQSRKVNNNIYLIQTAEAGVSNARNIGIDHAEGEYIVFVDDDDWVSENYLGQMLKLASSDRVVATNVIVIDDNTKSKKDYFLTQAYERCYGKKKFNWFSYRSFLSPACCKLIPRNVIGCDRFQTDLTLGEDSLFMFTVSRGLTSVILTPPNAIYYIRHRDNSASHSHYTYLYRMKLAFRTTYKYCVVYFSDMKRYNLLFFLTRIVATLRKLFQKEYQ